MARELARQREQEIARRAARHRPDHLADAMPALSVVAGVLLALAIGAPVSP